MLLKFSLQIWSITFYVVLSPQLEYVLPEERVYVPTFNPDSTELGTKQVAVGYWLQGFLNDYHSR